MPRRILTLALAALLLSSCAMLREEQPWPEQAPPRDFYVAHYRGDEANQAVQSRETYLIWVQRFYTGLNNIPGWLDMTERVLPRVEPERREEAGRRIADLGRQISRDWARDNSVRTLDSRMANVWRDALIYAIEQDDLFNYLSRLEEDVDALLAGQLDPEDIYFGRYYYDEFDF